MNPTLYILMRSDMASLNPGKACAQAAHAANAFVKSFNEWGWPDNEPIKEAFDTWQNQTSQGFGTTIVLAASKEKIDQVLGIKATNYEAEGQWVVDPTYPIRDGEVTHLINVETCAWYFVADRDKLVKGFNAITNIPLMA